MAAYPMRMGGGYTSIEVAHLATLNTATGRTSEPYDCMGHDPMVCHVGMRKDRSCAGALVLGERLEGACHIHTQVILSERVNLTSAILGEMQ